jgi:hypothetical protein
MAGVFMEEGTGRWEPDIAAAHGVAMAADTFFNKIAG